MPVDVSTMVDAWEDRVGGESATNEFPTMASADTMAGINPSQARNRERG
jgi:hypothetical protein